MDAGEVEKNIIDYIIVAAVFLVTAFNLFNFVDNGRIFSLISLSIATILLITIVLEYFQVKDKLNDPIRPAISILIYAVIAFVILNIILIYQMLQPYLQKLKC